MLKNQILPFQISDLILLGLGLFSFMDGLNSSRGKLVGQFRQESSIFQEVQELVFSDLFVLARQRLTLVFLVDSGLLDPVQDEEVGLVDGWRNLLG